MIKKNCLVLIILFVSAYSYSMERHVQDIAPEPLKKSLRYYNQKSPSPWSRFSRLWKKTEVQKTKVQRKNISLLPSVMILCLADFLNSMDTLRLSGTCTTIRQVFDDNYWIRYMSKIPKSFPCMRGSSPASNRKAFFAHLWYYEGRTKLAAKLDHLEARALLDYGRYGARIERDQYLCFSGLIRSIPSGKVDYEGTYGLRRAETEKLISETGTDPALSLGSLYSNGNGILYPLF